MPNAETNFYLNDSCCGSDSGPNPNRSGGGSGDVLFKSFPASKPTIELQQTRSRLTLRRTLITKLADRFRDKGEFRRGETYLFFTDLGGYEVEIAFELPTPVYSKLTKITCLSYRALSYSENKARQLFLDFVKAFSITSPDVSTHLRPD
jgi:hypothetical protein